MLPQLAQTLVYITGLVLIVLAAVFCLACGLYTAAEWLEDHVRTSFRIIKRFTTWSLAVQLTWLVIDRSAALPNLIGIASHINSWLLLKHHPNHLAKHWLPGVAAVVLLVAHQTSWIYWWFARYGAGWAVASVLASLVWPVPTMLLLSSASGDTLPVSVEPPYQATASSAMSPTAAAAAAAAAAKPYLDHVSGQLSHLRHQKPLLPETDAVRSRSMDQHKDGLISSLRQKSSGLSPSGAADGQQQPQQQGKKQHRSRVLQGFLWLQGLAKQHSLLPVSEADTEVVSPRFLTKLYKD